MKLLIIVNKLDCNDDLLGFFTGWLDDLARRCASIVVVTQFQGMYACPANVEIHLINKKQMASRLRRLICLWRIVWSERKTYDTIFCFMAPAWLVAVWPVAALARKKTAFWYAVWKGSFKLRVATWLADRIVTSVPQAFPIASSKIVAVGQGVDTEQFSMALQAATEGVLFLGRISPVKHIELLLQACAFIRERAPVVFAHVRITIAGAPTSDIDRDYECWLVQLANTLQLQNTIQWLGRVPHSQASNLYHRHQLFVNMTPTGSFDKTMLEAMASGCIAIASNQALTPFLDEDVRRFCIFPEGNSEDLALRMIKLMTVPEETRAVVRQAQRAVIIEHHSRQRLAERLFDALQTIS